MCREPWAEIVVTAQDLKHAGREELLAEFTQLEVAIRSERGGLDDDWVSGQQRRGDLAAGQVHGKVPWHDTDSHTERGVSQDDLLLVIFLDRFLLQLNVGKSPQPSVARLEFRFCKLKLDRGALACLRLW